MIKLKAVFWDVDGTLADTEMDGHRVAFNKAFKFAELNWYWNKEKYKELLEITGGVQRINYYLNQLGESLDPEKIADIHNNKQMYYQELIRLGLIPLRTGVSRLIKELRDNGVIQWIVTSSSKQALAALLNQYYPESKLIFSGLITSEDVILTKPNPECYIKSINKTGLRKKEIIAIEDSTSGLAAATEAGLSCLLTLTEWNNFSNISMSDATAVTNHLGDKGKPCSIMKGLPCPNAQINFQYLENLINQ